MATIIITKKGLKRIDPTNDKIRADNSTKHFGYLKGKKDP